MSMLFPILVGLVGFILTLVSPVLDGVERKIKARIHSRVGPPILQTVYDIVKLFRKEALEPNEGLPGLLGLGFLGSLLCYVIASISFCYSILGVQGVIVGVVFLASATPALLLAAVSPRNPFAASGAVREVLLALVNEVSVVVLSALIAYELSASFNPLLYTTLLAWSALACYSLSSRLPLDLAEAEPELASGVFIEASGPYMGLALGSVLARRAALNMLLAITLIAPLPLALWVKLLLLPVVFVAAWVVEAIIAPLMGRSRVDIAVKPLSIAYTVLAVVAVALIVMGA